MVTCPYCGSESNRKAGFYTHGEQKYLCKSCGKKHDGKTKRIREHKECPYCNGTNTKKGGKLRSGQLRWFCNDCNKFFSDSTIIREEITITCPDCNSNHINRAGKTPFGIQRYICKDCGRKFAEEVLVRPQKSHQVMCPKCNHMYAKKAGTTGSKNQYWICLSCGHKYLENPRYKHVTTKQKQEIISMTIHGYTPREIGDKFGKTGRTIKNILNEIDPKLKDRVCLNIVRKQEHEKELRQKQKLQQQLELENQRLLEEEKLKKHVIQLYHEDGLTQRQIANKLHISTDRVAEMTKGILSKDAFIKVMVRKEILLGNEVDKVCNKYGYAKENTYKLLDKDYKNESISRQQEELIIKFGVILNTPAEYVAPYIPCSIKLCNKIIKQHKHLYKPIKKPQLSEKEIAYDRMELDKFVGN